MKKKILSFLAPILIVCMMFGMFAGCGGTGDADTSPTSGGTDGSGVSLFPDGSDETNTPGGTKTVTYPLEGDDLELSLFYLLNEYSFTADEMSLWGALEEATGVHIDLSYAPAVGYGDMLSIMVNSGDLTDLIRNAKNNFFSGLDWAIEQEIIISMNDYIEDCMPDYYAKITSNSNYYNAIATSNGNIAEAVGLYYESYGPQSGFVIRQDWLDETGLDKPVTYDDWTETLTAFKVQLGVDYPLWMSSAGAYTGDFLGAGFGVASMTSNSKYPMYNVDGTIHFGPIESGYYSYLELVSGWYADGLISPDFASATGYMFPLPPTEPAEGKYGIWATMLGMFDQYKAISSDENFEIAPLTDAVLSEGDMNHLGFDIDYVNQGSVAITTSCNDVETACKWLNYGYTDAGVLLYNYGVEHEGFEYDAEGNPQYTDLVLNNPDMTFSAAKFRYAGGDNSPTVINYRTAWSTYSDSALSATEIWSSVSDGAYELPVNLALTNAEREEFYSIYTDIETYIMEYVLRFIVGETPLSYYDTFVDTINTMNIKRCIEIYQGALERALSS